MWSALCCGIVFSLAIGYLMSTARRRGSRPTDPKGPNPMIHRIAPLLAIAGLLAVLAGHVGPTWP
jgi:hypothetical protein